MALRELNFEVKLDLAKFNKQINDAENLAKRFNVEMTKVLDLKTRISKQNADIAASEAKILIEEEKVKKAKLETKKAQEKVNQEIAKTEKEIQKAKAAEEKAKVAAENTRKAMEGQTGAAQRTTAAVNQTSSAMSQLSQLAGVTFGVYGLRRFFSSLVDIAGQFEVQKMALRTMLQDVEAADKIFQDLYEFSSKSTYRFSELAQHAKQLSGFGIDKNDLLETTKMLGDVASGLGVSMDRIILAYGHVKSSGFLRGIQLRSFSQNGVPILEELAKMLTEIEGKAVSLGSIFDRMTKREISFEMVEEAFKRMTGEGGKFYKMQETLAETLAGKINILKGKWENVLGMTGMKSSGVLKDAVDIAINLLDHLDEVGIAIKSLLAYAGMYGVGLLAQAFKGLYQGVYTLINPIKALSKGFQGFNLTIQGALGWVGLLAAGIYNLIEYFSDTTDEMDLLEQHYEDLKNEIDKKALSGIADEISKIDTLNAKLHNNALAYEDRLSALAELQSIVPDYHANLTREGEIINDNISVLNTYKDKIKEVALAMARKEYLQKLYEERLGLEEDNEGIGDIYSPDWLANHKGIGLQEFGRAMAQRVVNDAKIADIDTRIESVTAKIVEDEETAVELTKDWQKAVDKIHKKYAGMPEGVLNAAVWKLGPTISEADWGSAVVKEEEELKKLIDLTDKRDKETIELYKKRLAVVRELKAAVHINWAAFNSKGNYSPKDGLTDEEKEEKDALTARINNIKTYLSELKQLMREGMSESEAADLVRRLNPLADPDELADSVAEYYALLRADLDEMANNPRLYSKSSQSILASFLSHQLADDTKEVNKKAKTLEKALAKLKNTIEDWSREDWNLEGTGVQLDVNKIIRDFNNKSVSLKKEGVEAIMATVTAVEKSVDVQEKARKILMDERISDEDKILMLQAEGIDYITKEELAAIRTRTDAQIDAQRVIAQEKIKNLASKYIKENELSPTDLSNMSVRQLLKYKDRLNEFVANLSPTGEKYEETFGKIKKMADDAGMSVDGLVEEIKDGAKDAAEKTDEQIGKKLAKTAKYAANQIRDLAKSIGELGEESGNDSLKQIGDAVDGIATGVSNIAQGFATGSWVGAAIAAISTIAGEIIKAAIAEEQFANAIRDANQELFALGLKNNLSEGVSSIFGDNLSKKLINAQENIGKINARLKELVDSQRKALSVVAKFGVDNARGLLANGSDLDVLLNKQITRQSAGWFSSEKRDSLLTALERVTKGTDIKIFDEYGNINADALQKVLDKYPDLTDAEKRFIQGLIDDSNAYAEAMEQVKDVLDDIIGDISDTLADKFIDRWIEARDVVIDYADALSDVAKQFAKMMIKQKLFEKVFTTQAMDDMVELARGNDIFGLNKYVADLMQRAADMGEEMRPILEALGSYMTAGDEAGTVGKGIQGITEDTASLLASYINAMRSDLSAVRMMQEVGWADVAAIAACIASPTLAEYLAQIQANTFNIAENNASILAELQSVIGAPGSDGRVVRTFVMA